MKFRSIIILLILFSSFSAMSGEKRELVLEMLEVTEARKNHETMIQTYLDQFSENPITNTDEFRAYFKEALAWNELLEPTISIYLESYTEEELRAIIQFFESPIGQSFVTKAPEVNKKCTAVMMTNIQKALHHLEPK